METKEVNKSNREFQSIHQQEYWLQNHKQIKQKINEKIGRFTTRFVILSFIGMMSISLISCKKTFTDDPTPRRPQTEQRELVNQEISLKGFNKSSMGSKGWDANTWVWNYNPGAYTLTFENVDNPAETITRNVSVQELINGITLSIYAGVYNITYQTEHINTTTIDISINQPSTTIAGTPVQLSANYLDFLMVFSIPTDGPVDIVGGAGTLIETFNVLDDFKYAYYNKTTDPIQGDLRIRYAIDGGSYKYQNMLSFTYGNVYWFTRPIGAGTTLQFPTWIVNKIQL